MKVSDYIANFLSKHTSHVFGGQGSSVIHIVDSIHKNKNIKFIPGQSEQGSSLAADAYYRVSNKIGVTIGTSGPGILNFLQGMGCSYFDSIPSLYIAGAPTVNNLRRNKKIRQIGFQEMEVQEMVKPICKYAVIIKNVKEVAYQFEKSIAISKSGRMGPVLIEIPDDISRMNMPKKLIRYKPKKKKVNQNKLLISKVKKMLENSKKPIFLVGNGLVQSGALNLFKKFIKKNKFPYAASWAVIDKFQTNHNLNAGSFGVAATRFGNFSIQSSDLIICLGLRLSSQIVGGNLKEFCPNAKKIVVDMDPEEFTNHRLPKIDLKIVSDVYIFLKNLNKLKFKTNNHKYDKWIKKINLLKKDFPIVSKNNIKNKNYVDPYFFFNELYKSIKKNSIIIPDASANLIWAYQCIRTDKKPEMFTAFNHSPMGYSMAASIGAYLGSKKKKIYAIIGDGSMPMNIQELETIKNYNIDVTIIVINNQGYGLIKQTQEKWLRSNFAGSNKKGGLSLPNNNEIAKSYKIKNLVLKNNKEVKTKIKNFLKLKGPLLIDIKIDPKSRVKPKIEFGNPLHNMSPLLSENKIKNILK